MTLNEMVDDVLSSVLDGDGELAEELEVADTAVYLGAAACVVVTADEVRAAMTSRRGLAALAERLSVKRRRLRRWLRRGGSLPIVAVQAGEIMRIRLGG